MFITEHRANQFNKPDEKINIVNLAAITLLPVFFLLSITYMSNTSLKSMSTWINASRKEFVLSYFLAFGIVNLLYIFNKKIYITSFFVLTSIFSVAAYVSKVKYMYRGEPLMPSDLNLGKEGSNIQQTFLQPNILLIVLSVALVLAGITLGLIFYPKEAKFKAARIFVPILAITLIATITYGKPVKLLKTFNIQEITWDQGENYHKNGFLLGFDTNIKWLNIQKPEGYDKQKIDKIVNGIKLSTSSISQKPNIIVIQSEAFWDVTRLSKIKFSKDPLVYFHSMQNKYTSGNLIVPVFGGGTTNTEFQVLTGMTDHFLPPGVMVYNQYLRNPMESAVTALKNDGYGATAVHSYWNWFYKRDEVYKHFGFDNFISAEFFNNPKMKGSYIGDQEVTNKIIDVLKQSKEPKLVYAVTMQNHGPYPTTGTYSSNVIADGNVSKQSLEMIERYADNLCDVDSALKSLITEIEKENRPTVVVLYGDHLPYLGADYQAYKESEYYSGQMDIGQYTKMYSTPFVIWNNIGLEKESLNISANFLFPYILNKVGLQGNVITEYDNELYNKGMRVIPKKEYDSNFEIKENALTELNQLQYDILFGNGYLYKENAPKDSDNYFLGLGRIIINSVNVSTSNGKTVLDVKGKNFTQTSWININGEIIKTNFLDDTHLFAELPEKYNENESSLKVCINVKDTLNRVIATSNVFQSNMSK